MDGWMEFSTGLDLIPDPFSKTEGTWGGLDSIEAKFRNQILVWNLLTRSIRFTCVFLEKRSNIENEVIKIYTGTEYSTIVQKKASHIPLQPLSPMWKPRKALLRSILRETNNAPFRPKKNQPTFVTNDDDFFKLHFSKSPKVCTFRR